MPRTAEINLLRKQSEAWDAWENPLITELGYGGAAGGGKTRLGWYLVITICETYPGSKCVVGRKELKVLRLTTLAELWIIFTELGYERGVDYTFNAQDNILKFKNGSEVLLLDTAYSGEDPEYTRFGSLPVTFGWCDESNETPEKAKSILKTRVGRANIFMVKGKKVEVKGFWLETFNPNKGHVHRDYYKPWKNGMLPPYRMLIRALPGDNPYLTKAYMENLNRADKITRERLLKGNFEFDDDPQKLMFYEAITDLPMNVLAPTTKLLNNGDVVPDVLRDSARYLIADIARFGGDKIVLGAFRNRSLYRLGVFTYQGTDETERQIKQWCIDEQIPMKNVLADEDGVGGGVVDHLRGIKGFHGNAAPTQIWDSLKGKMIPNNYQNMRSQCYFMLAEGVNERLWNIKIEKFETNIEGYTLDQALLDIFEELDAIKEPINSAGQKKSVIPKVEIKEQIGRSPDFSDILMMRMFFELKDETIMETRNYQPPSRDKIVVNKAR